MTGESAQAKAILDQAAPQLAHLWMIRTFLKHAEEVQDHDDVLEVPRALFDAIRAAEPSMEAGDYARALHKLRGKFPKLEAARDLYLARFREISDHTNHQMAAQSLDAAVKALGRILTSGQSG
ncbi:MAG: amidohydrolase [Planctomycetes bacterium]|nr:amidohydrolase [Planctomycetota bacterium]